MEVTADEAYEVEMPAFGEKLEQFGIVDFTTTQPELLDGRQGAADRAATSSSRSCPASTSSRR